MGIRMILKKFDKRLGFRHIGNHYIVSRSNHPYSQLQQVFRQVVIEYLILPILSLSLSLTLPFAYNVEIKPWYLAIGSTM